MERRDAARADARSRSPCNPHTPTRLALAAGLQFCSATFHALGQRVKALADELCDGRLVFLLEGGYDLEALGQSVANTFLGETLWLCRRRLRYKVVGLARPEPTGLIAGGLLPTAAAAAALEPLCRAWPKSVWLDLLNRCFRGNSERPTLG